MNDYDMSVLYNPGKANLVADSLSFMTMGSVSHVEEYKKDLVKDVHIFSKFGVKLEDSTNSGFRVHHHPESFFLVEVKSKQYFDQALMELKESVLGKLNESFSYGVLR